MNRGTGGSSGTSKPRREQSTKQRRPAKVFHLPLRPLIDEFLEDVELTLAPATGRAYRIPLMLFVRYAEETLGREPRLDDLNLTTTRAWMTALRETPKHERGGRGYGAEPLALASLRNYLRHVRAFANWLPKPPHRYCEESPLKYLKMPRGEEVPKMPVEPDALRQLLRRAGRESDPVASARGRAMLLALVDGGLRAHELIALTVADVSLKEGILLVRRAKGRRPRLVAVGQETIRALRRYALLRDGELGGTSAPGAVFFLSKGGSTMTYAGLRSWLRRLERDAQVGHVYLHQLRHTSAIETLDAGADLRTVQLKMGHADIRTTQGYLNMSADHAARMQRASSPVERLGLRASDEDEAEPTRLPRGADQRRQRRPGKRDH